MDALNAKPKLLKQANLTLIRRFIRDRFTATKAEIAAATLISSTTVRSLLAEMLEAGEIESIGFDESSGGRKAERYRFRHGRYYAAAFYLKPESIRFFLVNVCGEIEREGDAPVSDGDYFGAIAAVLDGLMPEITLRSIGVGVPGVVDRGVYRKKNAASGALDRFDLGDALAARYGLPVVLENNVNATAIGYLRRSGAADGGGEEAAYIQFDRSCIEAGLIAGGRILRGCNNFAGELGLIPLDDGKLLHEHLDDTPDDEDYIRTLTRVVGWLYCILNPRRIVLGGRDFRPACIAEIKRRLSLVFPAELSAEILHSPDPELDYAEGIAYLAASKMFDDVQFVKE